MDYILTYEGGDELYHHGIKGMRWGVRRYQNYDGSYTKKGLARYNKASERYEASKKRVAAAKRKFESSSYDRNKALNAMDELKAAKKESKAAKREMKSSYKKLKQDYVADKGKELYRSGQTITGNEFKKRVAAGASIVGDYLVGNLYQNGVLSPAAAAAIEVGQNAAFWSYAIKKNSDNSKLRAYYAH